MKRGDVWVECWIDIDAKVVHLDEITLHDCRPVDVGTDPLMRGSGCRRLEGVTWCARSSSWMIGPDLFAVKIYSRYHRPRPYGRTRLEAARNALAYFEWKAERARMIEYTIERTLLPPLIADLERGDAPTLT